MKLLLILFTLAAITLVIPTPQIKTTTSCVNEECISDTSVELGPSLYKMLIEGIKK